MESGRVEWEDKTASTTLTQSVAHDNGYSLWKEKCSL